MLTTAQQVRARLNDRWRRGSEMLVGDGSASAYQLREGAHAGTNVISGTASVITQNGWSATGCTFDTALGDVSFSAKLSYTQQVRVDYLYAVFSEDDIAYFTAVGGGAAGAALEGVKWLMGDAWKRARFSAPDDTSYDDSKAMDNLQKLYDTLLSEVQGEAAGPVGGIESWSVEQGNF